MRERGFTLIETAIAMGLLAFIVADVGMVAMTASRSAAGAQHLTQAVSLAESLIEDSRNTDFSDLQTPLEVCRKLPPPSVPDCRLLEEDPCTVSGTSVTCRSNPGELTAATGLEKFVRVRTVTTPPGTTLDTALWAQVEVGVSWVDVRGESQQYRLVTLVSKF
jgi:type II secretory pathway pseudopilin PulG